MIGSLFSGAGGLDLAVEATFGQRTAWHCELDAAASKVLAARWPGVPNHGDITQIDWAAIEPVDVLCGGYPCQPFSAAGKRKGSTDERHLWPYFAEAIRCLRPRFVVLENVAGHRSMGFDRVLADLAGIGYDTQWCSVRASDVGAPHRRERLFVLAHPEGDGRARLNGRAGSAPARSGRERLATGSDGRTTVTDSPCDGRDEGRPQPARLIGGSDAAISGDGSLKLLPTPHANDWRGGMSNQPGVADIPRLLPTPTSRDSKGANQRADDTCLAGALLPTPNAADSHRGPDLARANRDGSGGDDLHTFVYKTNRDQQWGKYEPAIRRWETLTHPAPEPTEPNTKGNPRLAAAFSEWMMGWPAGWVTAVPGISRNDALRIVGNGVVPQCAAAALRWLLTVAEQAA